MKKIVFVLILLSLSMGVQAQKKKKAPAKKATTTTATAAKGVLAKADNLTAEVKNGVFQVTINEAGKTAESITVKNTDPSFKPTNCKLTGFMANGVKLYVLTWTENVINKTQYKTEDITTIYSVVYEIPNKKQVFSNTQITNKITEIVFLDRLKTASETQEKVRREGFEFVLNPDGTLIQRSKTQENKWVYDKDKMEFVDAKKKK